MKRWLVALVVLAGCDEVFDLVHVEPSDASDTACFRDEFDALDQLLLNWTRESSGSGMAFPNGQLAITLQPLTEGDVGILSIAHYDITGKAVSIRATSVVAQTGNVASLFTLRVDDNNYYSLQVRDTKMFFMQRLDNNLIETSIGFEPTAHIYWRIAQAGDEIGFYTSMDGSLWTMQHARPADVPFQAMTIHIGATQSFGGNAMPGTAIYDEFSLCPVVN